TSGSGAPGLPVIRGWKAEKTRDTSCPRSSAKCAPEASSPVCSRCRSALLTSPIQRYWRPARNAIRPASRTAAIQVLRGEAGLKGRTSEVYIPCSGDPDPGGDLLQLLQKPCVTLKTRLAGGLKLPLCDCSWQERSSSKKENMMDLWPRLMLAGLCLTVSAGFPAFFTSSDKKQDKAPPDLSGIWKINEDLSQTPQQGARESRPQGGVMGGERGGGGRGGGGGMGRRGCGSCGGGDRGGAGEAGRPDGPGGPDGGSYDEQDGVMTITWAAPQITVEYPNNRKRVYFTDGRKIKEDLPGGRTVKTRASWTDGGSLEVVTKLDNGMTRTEIFEISNDGRRLFVIIGLEGRGPEPVKFHRVYDKFDAKDKEEDEDADPQLASLSSFSSLSAPRSSGPVRLS